MFACIRCAIRKSDVMAFSFCFVLFRFVAFHFVSLCFVLFRRDVSFHFVKFRFVRTLVSFKFEIGESVCWRVGELASWRVGGLASWRVGELASSWPRGLPLAARRSLLAACRSLLAARRSPLNHRGSSTTGYQRMCGTPYRTSPGPESRPRFK